MPMGMFDKQSGNITGSPLAGNEFVVTRANFIGNTKSADYGDNLKAEVTAHPVGDPENTKTYACYGVLAEQIGRMGRDDLPAVVKLGREGRAHVWEFIRKPTDDDTKGETPF